MPYLHQLWTKKPEDTEERLVFQIQNEEPVHDLKPTIAVWEKAGYTARYTQQYFYNDPGVRVGPDIDVKQRKGLKYAYKRSANPTVNENKRKKQNNNDNKVNMENTTSTTTKKPAKTKASPDTYDVKGQQLTIKEIAHKYKINVATVRARAMSGKRGDDLITSNTQRKQKNTYPYQGMEKTIDELAKMAFVSVAGMRARLKKYNNNAEDAVADKGGDRRGKKGVVYIVKGEEMTISQISTKFNINTATLRARLQRGWTGDQLISNNKSNVPKLSNQS